MNRRGSNKIGIHDGGLRALNATDVKKANEAFNDAQLCENCIDDKIQKGL